MPGWLASSLHVEVSRYGLKVGERGSAAGWRAQRGESDVPARPFVEATEKMEERVARLVSYYFYGRWNG